MSMKFIFTIFKSLKRIEWNNQRVRVSEVLVGKNLISLDLEKICEKFFLHIRKK